MGHRLRLVGGALAAGALVVAAAGCGVTHDKTARPIDSLPFGLAEPTTTSTTVPPPPTTQAPPTTTAPTTTTTVPTERAALYFVAADRIRLETRFVPLTSTGGKLDPTGTLRQLEAGPATPDLQNLLLPDMLGASPVAVDRGRALVTLTPVSQALNPPLQLAVAAQVVLTLTERPGIGHVAFVDQGGQPVAVPRADGSVADDVAAEDYRPLLAA